MSRSTLAVLVSSKREKLARLTPPSSPIRTTASPRSAFISSLTFWQTADFQSASAAHLSLQLSDPSFRPPLFSIPRKDVADAMPKLPPPAVQHMGADLQHSRRLSYGYPFRRTAASLNSFV